MPFNSLYNASSTLVQSVQPLPRVGQNPEVPVAHVNDTIPFWHLNGLDQAMSSELGKIPKDQSDLSQCNNR